MKKKITPANEDNIGNILFYSILFNFILLSILREMLGVGVVPPRLSLVTIMGEDIIIQSSRMVQDLANHILWVPLGS